MTIGQRISELRKKYSYSQEYVAEKLGVSRQAVSKWENDTTAPDTYNLIALAELFNVSVEYIAVGKQYEQAEVLNLPQSKSITSKKVLGFIFLGTGLLSLIFGVLFSEILIMICVFLITLAIFCLLIRQNFFIVTSWAFWLLMFLFFNLFIGRGFLYIFFGAFNPGGINCWVYIGGIWFIINLAVTIKLIVNRKKTK